MKTFEIGNSYSMTYIGDSDLVVTYTVLDRTACTLTITDGRNTKKCRINKKLSEFDGNECVMPEGKYSMAPILRACNLVQARA